jgi:transcriptional repressor NrdR
MKCPFCQAQDTKVLDSRSLEEGQSIRRRRKCETCLRRFTTYESIEITMPMVVKNDGRRENFNREKISGGIKKACQKLPISTAQVEHTINNIEKAIFEVSEKEVTTKEIGRVVMSYLRSLDPVAYIRFASVYCNFKDVQEFFRDIQVEDGEMFPLRKNNDIKKESQDIGTLS